MTGTQSGREIEIFNSYELNVKEQGDGGAFIVDKEFFVTKQEQYRQVFPKFDFLGWYTIGGQPTPGHMAVHQQFFLFNESPLFLQLNPAIPATAKELPISIYESILGDATSADNSTVFLKVPFKIETGEAERIAVDHVAAQISAAGAGTGSSLQSHLTTQRNAIKMLHTRIILLQKYVASVEAGTLPRDHSILRDISSAIKRLPAMDGVEFRREFLMEYNDVLLESYLATITKGAHSICQLVDKVNLITKEKVDKRGGRGGMMQMQQMMM